MTSTAPTAPMISAALMAPMALFLSFFLVVVSPCLMAQERGVASQTEISEEVSEEVSEREVARRSQERSYPGGADEEDLQVQELVAEPRSLFSVSKVQNQLRKEIKKESKEAPAKGLSKKPKKP